ncbi:MAG TPA: FG-GAP-like repeat-containing protein [Aridibacter sp.]|nr:FG-GAP-like repeat-containing protein [Aridibacter sp.]
MRSTVSNRLVLVYCFAVLAFLVAGFWLAVGPEQSEAKESKDLKARSVTTSSLGGTTFPGTGVGAIPDRGATGCGEPRGPARDITFNVTGLSGAPTTVGVDFTATHTWVGDLNISLISPDATEHVVQEATGAATATACGDSSDLSGLYSFNDGAAGDWWAAAIAAGGAEPLPNTAYRTQSAGRTGSGGANTVMTAAFSGIPASNGTWTLRFTDSGGGDTGTVSAANLSLEAGAAPTGSTNVDMDGDGTTDYSIVRDGSDPDLAAREEGSVLLAKSVRERLQRLEALNDGQRTESVGAPPPVGSDIDWYISNSGGGDPTIASFGEPTTDFVIPTDFDGDGNADIAVWRGVNTTGPEGAFFYIFRSSDSTIDIVDLGIQGDDPTVSGDYDGDGVSDPAVFRCPSTAGQCVYYYIGSNQALGASDITFVPWGFGTSFSVFPNIGDFDGDGRHDFCVQTDNPDAPGQGLFTLLRSSDFGVEYVSWGLNTDLIAPGDYDGDGQNDFAVVRNEGGQLVWYILEKDGGTRGAAWGLQANDFLTPGDYDGDGLTDVAVYRATEGNWYVLNSGSGTASGYDWGHPNIDYPLPNWQVH